MTTNMPVKISVVIPTYNRPEYLKHCLRCLAIQAGLQVPFEVVVVTDGPDAVSEQAAQQFVNTPGMLLRVIALSCKKGPAAARNLGWQQARGDLILFTDDDCLPAANFINAYANAWMLDMQPLVAFTGKLVVPLPNMPTDYEKNTSLLATAEFVTANCACTKSALEKVGGFDEAFTMAWREDSDLHFKLEQHQIPILRVTNAVIIHPVRKARWGVSIREQKKSMFNALLKKKHPQLFRQKIGKKPLWNYYAMAATLIATIIFVLLGKPWPAVISFLVWLFLTLSFAYKRLRTTSREPSHIAEMLVTSAVIPLLSIYWTLYGSWRYKILHL